MAELPSGTITLLFTDIEGSTRLLRQLGDRYAAVLDDHRRLLRAAVKAFGGREVDTQGDAFFVAFARAADAVGAAVAAQRALLGHKWPDGVAVAVRMGLHTGEPVLAGGGYVGLDVHRAARLCAAGHGGQIVLSAAVRDLVEQALPDGIGLRDMGEHRLKDLRLPERVFQLLAKDLPAEFPPLRSLDTSPNNLPRQLTSFVGREREIEEVGRLLGTTALLTLVGTGGAGKTRLALQVAADRSDAFPDGVWLIELAPLADPSLVPQAVASALGVRPELHRPLGETLAEFLKSRELLLVLDNCEHLIEACAALVDRLLRSSRRLRILATSREALGIAGEVAWRVPSLSLPESTRPVSVEQLTRYEAIRLFVDRAGADLPSFAVTSQNATALAEVCRRLDGIPLALELAAARVSGLAVEQIAERLDQRFRLLSGGSRAALPRQQTLRALVDWSYDLLSEQERALLRRLSVFAGGWTLEAAEAICSGGDIHEYDVLDLLLALIGKSLVQVEDQGGTARYRLLETIRQYGVERLRESGEEPVLRGRHLDWFLCLAERTAPELRGPRQADRLDQFETEHDNFRAALDWSAAADQIEPALRLATTLGDHFWGLRGHHGEGRSRLEGLLTRAAGRVPVRARALTVAGYLALRQGDYSAARPLLEESLAISRELGDKRDIAKALAMLGEVLHGQGETDRAATLIEESLALSRELSDSGGIQSALFRLADIAYGVGDYPQATTRYQESLALSRERADAHGVAYAQRGLGNLARTRADYARATALLHESLRLLVDLRDRRCTPLCLESLAWVAGGLGQPERAARLFGVAEQLRDSIGVALLPADQADHDRAEAAALAALGEEAFSAASAEGRAMSPEQAVAYALAESATR